MSARVRVQSPTEARNPRTAQVDELDTLAVLETINDEDATVAAQVRAALPRWAEVVDRAVAAIRDGGTVHYFGAGTSGRLGVLDAAELPPTYGIEPGVFVAHLAGGERALVAARENVEDEPDDGALDATAVGPGDVAIGLTASGRTPYVAGALAAARRAGALTVLVTSNPAAPIAADVDIPVCVATGPEVIAGSTRMKSATALKLMLNAFSTAVMIRLGRTWSNLMVSVTPTNAKLRGRLVQILVDATGLGEARCEAALADADGQLPTALVALLAEVSTGEARTALGASDGVVARAVRRLMTG